MTRTGGARRWVGRVVVVAVGSYVAVVVAGWALQTQLVYEPSGAPPSLAELGVSGETVVLTTADGLELEAWYFPSAGAPAPALLSLGGKGGGRSDRVLLGEAFRRRGISVLLLDYRGFGGNPGTPGEAGPVLDAAAGLAWLRARTDVSSVVVLGESLGTGVAVALAADHEIDGLVLRSPFTELADVPAARYPLLPFDAVLRDEYDTEAVIEGISDPVLVVAGSEDDLIPVSQSRKVFELANEPKRWMLVDGAGHVDRAFLDGEVFGDAVEAFVEEVVGG